MDGDGKADVQIKTYVQVPEVPDDCWVCRL